MNKKRILLVSFLTTVILGTVLFIKTSNFPVFSQEIGVSVVEEYTQVENLKSDSDYIVDAKVLETESFLYEGLPFTLSKLKIKETFKSEFKKNDVINVLETGGVIDNTEYTVEHDKNLKKNSDVVLYLYEYEGPIKKDIEKYVVTGLYQGKFQHENDLENLTPSEGNVGELAEVESIENLNLDN